MLPAESVANLGSPPPFFLGTVVATGPGMSPLCVRSAAVSFHLSIAGLLSMSACGGRSPIGATPDGVPPATDSASNALSCPAGVDAGLPPYSSSATGTARGAMTCSACGVSAAVVTAPQHGDYGRPTTFLVIGGGDSNAQIQCSSPAAAANPSFGPVLEGIVQIALPTPGVYASSPAANDCTVLRVNYSPPFTLDGTDVHCGRDTSLHPPGQACPTGCIQPTCFVSGDGGAVCSPCGAPVPMVAFGAWGGGDCNGPTQVGSWSVNLASVVPFADSGEPTYVVHGTLTATLVPLPEDQAGREPVTVSLTF
jgi:hypothetical protein